MPSNIFDPIDQGARPVIDRWHHEVHQAAGVVSEAVTAFAGDAERIFNKSEDYVIKITPVGDVQVTIDGLFYEESTL